MLARLHMAYGKMATKLCQTLCLKATETGIKAIIILLIYFRYLLLTHFAYLLLIIVITNIVCQVDKKSQVE